MSGDECGEFVTAVLVLVASAFIIGVCVLVPWLGVFLVVVGIVWLVRGWIRDG